MKDSIVVRSMIVATIVGAIAGCICGAFIPLTTSEPVIRIVLCCIIALLAVIPTNIVAAIGLIAVGLIKCKCK